MSARPAVTMIPEAAACRVRPVDFAGIPAIELRDANSGALAVFARRGATLLDWRVRDGGNWVALTDGYRSDAEFAAQNGVRNGLLAPFCNRIAVGRYTFEGQAHDLLPGVPAAERLIYHGFLRGMDLALTDLSEAPAKASIQFTAAIHADDFPGYPFALKLNVRIDFTPVSLAFTITATNVGDQAAPYAAGWHPYFRLGDTPVDQLALEIPAARCVVTGHELLPLSGAAAWAPIDAGVLPDFRRARTLCTAVLDGCYAGATPDADGLIRSRLRDPATGRQLTIWQRGGLTHVFTGDTLARDARRSIAIEPVEAMTDAFNRPECAGALRLPPGASSSFSFGAEFSRTPPSPTLTA